MAGFSIGLGAFLTFDGSKFSSGIKKPRDELGRFIQQGKKTSSTLARIKVVGVGAFKALSRSMGRMRAGLGKVQQGLTQAAFAFAPLTIGVVAGAKSFANFQQQMQNVSSVSNFLPGQFDKVKAKAKELGASTQFTATEAGQAFEELSRQGFDFEDQMGSIGGVLSLAAADSIELGTAAQITTNILNAMRLDAGETTRVVDVLAATSANSATNVTQLGEAFKFAAPIAAEMGIEVEDTAVALGLIANAGLKGTLGGNSFKNMLIKLAKPTAKAKKLMKEYKLQVFETADGNLDLKATMDSVIQGTKGITSATKRAGVIAEVFGLRGMGAVSGIATSIKNGKFDELTAAVEKSKDAAKDMAATRLDSFTGQMTLLKSAAEGLAIEFFEPFVEFAQGALKEKVIPFLQDVVAVMQELGSEGGGNVDELREKFGAAADVALGIKDAIEAIQAAFKFVIAKVKEFGAKMEERFGPNTLRNVIKFATIFALVAAAIAPVILAVVGIGFAISAISTVVSGVASIISGAFLPLLLIGGGLVLLFLALQEENESFGETAVRVWGIVKAWALDVWENVLKPLWAGIKEAADIVIPELKRVWQESFAIIKEAIKEVFDVLGISLGEGETNWKDVGMIMVFVIASVIEAIIKLATFLIVMFSVAVKIFKQFFFGVMDNLLAPFLEVWNLVRDLFKAFQLVFQGDIIGGLKMFGKALLNFILAPLRLIIRNIVRLADAIPGLGSTIPDVLRDFANEGTISLTATDGPSGRKGKRGTPAFLKSRDKKTGAEVAKKGAEAGAEGQMAGLQAMVDGMKDGLAGLKSGIGKGLDAVKGAVDKAPCIDNNISVAVDNETIARGQAKHKQEVNDRAGFNTTPWQRRTALEFGAAPVRGSGAT